MPVCDPNASGAHKLPQKARASAAVRDWAQRKPLLQPDLAPKPNITMRRKRSLHYRPAARIGNVAPDPSVRRRRRLKLLHPPIPHVFRRRRGCGGKLVAPEVDLIADAHVPCVVGRGEIGHVGVGGVDAGAVVGWEYGGVFGDDLFIIYIHT